MVKVPLRVERMLLLTYWPVADLVDSSVSNLMFVFRLGFKCWGIGHKLGVEGLPYSLWRKTISQEEKISPLIFVDNAEGSSGRWPRTARSTTSQV